ncbi:MAG: hypothetical protein KatS3mg105_2872 [Gemmatales bacterium]|nr:MAG: hypothetical protein KatS3mg105_2872 [Gemmatales bacterium]
MYYRLALLAMSVVIGSASAVPLLEDVYPAYTDLTGTTWSGDGAVAYTIYVFERGGVLQYSYNGNTYRNGTWKQHGPNVYFEANQKYWEFEGVIRGDVIVGKSWNRAGRKWPIMTMRRQPSVSR